MTALRTLLLAAAVAGAPGLGLAAEAPGAPPAAAPAPKVWRTEGAVRVGGKSIPYQAIAGETFLPGPDGAPAASIFSTTYLRTDVRDPRPRPILFLFNGGPGAGSAWMHVGGFGPRIVAAPDNAGDAGAAPYRLQDNAETLLDVADLVFVDPVGTGFSRAVGAGRTAMFWGVEEDAAANAQFMRQHLLALNRWGSPKYLVGESYGGLRVAKITEHLTKNFGGVELQGVILVSAVIDMLTILPLEGIGEAYAHFLPSYTAAAARHGKISAAPEALPALLDEARAFALDRYLPALARGSRLKPAEADALAGELSRFTGLSKDYILRADLKVNPLRFTKELLRDRGVVAGRWDARAIGKDRDDAGETFDADPSGYHVDGLIVGGALDYFSRELGVRMDGRYELLNAEVRNGWNWTTTNRSLIGPSAANAAPALADALRQNKSFRVFAATGLYDLATPFFAMETTLAVNGVDGERVQIGHYPAGHMIYMDAPARRQLAADLRAFVAAGGAESEKP